MGKTSIEWTDEVWNPVRGCLPCSTGCEKCYAMKQAHRFSGKDGPYEGLTVLGKRGPRWTGEVRIVPDMLDRPMHWKKPRTVFVNSMSDLFHEKVPSEFIAAVFGVMAACPRHQFVILTKRDPRGWFEFIHQCRGWPLPNVAIGVSCENQEQVDKRIPWLLGTPAACRFVSAEPLLGPIDFVRPHCDNCHLEEIDDSGEAPWCMHCDTEASYGHWLGLSDDEKRINGVILGCESGPKARPMHEDWARSIRDQCAEAGTAFFLKQLMRNGNLVSMPELDGRQWTELPWRTHA